MIFLYLEDMKRLEEIKLDLNPSAKDLGLKKCTKCSYCCHRRSCIPTPKELMKITKFLGLSMKDAINQYFCIDHDNGSTILYVKPAGINQLDLLGKEIPLKRTYNEGKCIFLSEDNLCKIYTVRPTMARKQKCWDPLKDPKKHRKKLLEKWEKFDLWRHLK